MRTTRWSVGLAFAAAILAPLGTMAFQAAAPTAVSTGQPPPVKLTNHEDHQRLMGLLNMTTIRRGRDGTNKDSPFFANYDESKANPYPNLPDPLTFKNGKKVAKASDWPKRRAEIVEDFDREVYGRMPKVTPKVKWEVLNTTEGKNGDVDVITRQLAGKVDNSSYPDIKVEIAVTLVTPKNAKGPVPVVMQFGGFGFGPAPGGAGRGVPGAAATVPAGPPPPPSPPYGPGAFRAARGGGRGPVAAVPGRGVPGAPPVAAPGATVTAPPAAVPAAGAAAPAIGRGGFPGGGRGPQGPTWQQQVLARGWGYATISPASIQDDDGAGLTLGIIGLVNKGQPRKLDDWGTLRAWAWGVSRALDYFETDKAVDAKHVALEGHSRYGKATLVTMAYEPRLWTAYVSSSGEGGAKLHRRDWGEIIENVAGEGEYWWMAGNFIKYAGPLNWNDLPVDSHELIALCAPRPVFVSAGKGGYDAEPGGDSWVDAKGSFLAAVGAGPVYKLLSKKDMGTTEFPSIETGLMDGDVAFRQHSSGHTDGPNWPTFLNFAARYLPAAKK